MRWLKRQNKSLLWRCLFSEISPENQNRTRRHSTTARLSTFWLEINTGVVLPRNFFGGFSRSPPAGSTTQRSSTSLERRRRRSVNVHHVYGWRTWICGTVCACAPIKSVCHQRKSLLTAVLRQQKASTGTLTVCLNGQVILLPAHSSLHEKRDFVCLRVCVCVSDFYWKHFLHKKAWFCSAIRP